MRREPPERFGSSLLIIVCHFRERNSVEVEIRVLKMFSVVMEFKVLLKLNHLSVLLTSACQAGVINGKAKFT